VKALAEGPAIVRAELRVISSAARTRRPDGGARADAHDLQHDFLVLRAVVVDLVRVVHDEAAGGDRGVFSLSHWGRSRPTRCPSARRRSASPDGSAAGLNVPGENLCGCTYGCPGVVRLPE